MDQSLIIACPQCSRLNRIPGNKTIIDGKCGSCKHSLSSEIPLELNQGSFSSHIVKSDLPVLVDFWAPWCGPCKMMIPVLEAAAKQLSPDIRIAKINTESEQQLAAQFNIRSIPTLAIFHKGKELDRIAGAMPIAQLLQWTHSTLDKL